MLNGTGSIYWTSYKPNRVDSKVEEAIVDSRKLLERRDTPRTKYAFVELSEYIKNLIERAFEDKPSLATINRILKR